MNFDFQKILYIRFFKGEELYRDKLLQSNKKNTLNKVGFCLGSFCFITIPMALSKYIYMAKSKYPSSFKKYRGDTRRNRN